ncbi:hypothetical protein G6L37_11775 [Agrobacterium rubi]|uniref:hypothetical protein n=1 Tax=Agrobacterium rubi TaxID=28099 RepID=UPI001571B142|nr:hypothetical protein [Agrobacterium rubi]NTF06840.1 hypothetical protein [Agrobacterium rubi]NTF19082.1 hypothetical protein [Agrobacterium rubi]NTF26045.1 hypothetical protein [Agrobacterium rubi]
MTLLEYVQSRQSVFYDICDEGITLHDRTTHNFDRLTYAELKVLARYKAKIRSKSIDVYDPPQEVIDWLLANGVQGTPQMNAWDPHTHAMDILCGDTYSVRNASDLKWDKFINETWVGRGLMFIIAFVVLGAFVAGLDFLIGLRPPSHPNADAGNGYSLIFVFLCLLFIHSNPSNRIR